MTFFQNCIERGGKMVRIEIWKSLVVLEQPDPSCCEEPHWHTTTCPHSAGKERSSRYPATRIGTISKFTIKRGKSFFLTLASRISLPSTNLETFLSFPLLGWYRRKVTDLSHHQPSAWLTNQICPSLTVLWLITVPTIYQSPHTQNGNRSWRPI